MASVNFSGQLDRPLNEEAAGGDKIYFYPLNTVGEIIQSAASIMTIDESGNYDITLGYNNYSLYYYSDVSKKQTYIANVTVSADTVVSTLPDLIGSTTPVTEEAELIIQGYLSEAQGYATDAETARDEAAQSAAEAEDAKNSIDYDISRLDLKIRFSDLNRPPRRDDYFAPAKWQYDGNIESSTRSYNGSSTAWTRIELRGKPYLDALTSTPEAVWHMVKLISDYDGPCIRVLKSNGAELDIYFDDDDYLDFNALYAFTGSSRVQIVTWYDQTGNGHHMTSEDGNRPFLSRCKDNKTGLYYIHFERLSDYDDNATDIPSTFEQMMTIPDTLTGSTDSLSMISHTKCRSSYRTASMVELTGDDGTFVSIGNKRQTNIDCIAVYDNSSIAVKSEKSPLTEGQITCATFDSTNIDLYVSDRWSTTGNKAGTTTFTGGRIGGGFENFRDGSLNYTYSNVGFMGVIIYGSSISSSIYSLMSYVIYKKIKETPQIRGNIVFDGDSITESDGAEDGRNWGSVARARSTIPFNVYNVARGGSTYPNQESSFFTWAESIYESDDLYNLVVVSCGSNDIAGGDDSDTVIANLQSYVTNIQAEGYDVVIGTIIPRRTFNEQSEMETYRLTVNQWIRDNYESLGCLGIIDFASDPTMGTTSNVEVTSFFQDGTHPTQLGYEIMGGIAAEALEPIIEGLIVDAYS
jgi:lysophospholipase L1-like esterase